MSARWLSMACALALLACGGSAPTIKHRMPIEKVWHTPPEERDTVAAAHKQLSEVRGQLEHTRFLIWDADRQVEIARAERNRAKQDVRIASLEKERRDKSYLTSLAQSATSQLLGSRNKEKSLDKKVAWLEAQRRYLKLEADHLEAASMAAEAKLELAKAELAVRRGFVTSKSASAPFKSQAQSMDSRAAAKRRNAEAARRKAEAARKAWGGK